MMTSAFQLRACGLPWRRAAVLWMKSCRRLGSEPLSRAERIAYARLIGEQWAYERDACDAHLMDLWREYPLGIPQ